MNWSAGRHPSDSVVLSGLHRQYSRLSRMRLGGEISSITGAEPQSPKTSDIRSSEPQTTSNFRSTKEELESTKNKKRKAKTDVVRLQIALSDRGYAPGPIDANLGQSTLEAVRNYLRENQTSTRNTRIFALIEKLVGIDKQMDHGTGTSDKKISTAREYETSTESDPISALGWKPIFVRLPSKTRRLDPTTLFRTLNKSVWVVLAGNDLSQPSKSMDLSQGSGVVIASSLLLTNCHVVSGRREIGIFRKNVAWRAEVVSADTYTDRCVLRAQTESLNPVPGIKRFIDLEVGEKVFTIGSPKTLENTLGDGLISGLRETERGRFIQTTAPMSPGSSGGGLFDEFGNLIGVITLTLNNSGSLNFAMAARQC